MPKPVSLEIKAFERGNLPHFTRNIARTFPEFPSKESSGKRAGSMTDEELRQVALDFRSGFDEDPIFGGAVGMCYAISAPLAGLLNFYGIECELVKSDHSDIEDSNWWEHYWIRLKDGRALDPTFDQFGVEAVYLGEPTRFHGGHDA